MKKYVNKKDCLKDAPSLKTLNLIPRKATNAFAYSLSFIMLGIFSAA